MNSISKSGFQLVSDCRSELMGIGILGVLVGHWLKFSTLVLNPTVETLIRFLCGLVFTTGFLFLSGFGLYSSFTKDNSLKSFYTKRVKRVYLPYLIITLPFFLIGDFFLFRDGSINF